MNWHCAMTVTGPVDGQELGVTYVHEHLMVKPQLDAPAYIPYTLQDEEASAAETRSFLDAGGRTLVEMTPLHYGRDPAAYRRIAEKTGAHILCCTGFHKELFMPPWFDEKSDAELYDLLMGEITDGLDGTGVRPGVLKLGTSYDQITPREARSLAIAARVHRDTGIPLSTHCDKGTMGMEQLQALERCGVDPSEVLLCHIDSRRDTDYAKALCQTGATICIDHVGRELADTDAFRVEMITDLVEAGYADRVTLAGDMGKTDYLPAYGGKPGFAYILTQLYDALLPRIGEAALHTLLVDNPRRIFAGQP